MAKTKFENPDVEAKYEATGEKDVKIHIGKHHGPLSRISPATAEALMKVKDPNIREKNIVTAAATTTDPAK